jgi:hypothetical protein
MADEDEEEEYVGPPIKPDLGPPFRRNTPRDIESISPGDPEPTPPNDPFWRAIGRKLFGER